MKIKLVIPPAGDYTSPYPSIASLDAFLKLKGLESEQYDMNLEVYDYIFSKEYMTLCLEELKSKGASSSKLELVEYLADNIDECKNALRSDAGMDGKVSKACYDLLKTARDVVNDLWKTEALRSNNYINDAYSLHNRQTVSECIDDTLTGKRKSRLCDIMSRFVDDLVKDAQVVGISVSFIGQMFPTFMLAALCKIAKPDIKIVIGGTLATTWTKRLDALRPMFKVVDYFSFFEGERSIEGLMRYLMGETGLQEVPSLCYLDEDRIVLNPSDEPISMDELPTPVYEKKYLHRYFSPRPILSLLTCRGCYWNRCSFCSHGAIYRNCFRTRKPQLVVDDIEHYINEYGAKYFSFNDEAITAPMLKKISQEIIDRKLDIVWRDYARFDKGLSKEILEIAHKSGLRSLLFGLESYNERVLSVMNKGIKREYVEPILKACHETGIWNHVFFIVGFPTETYEEFRESCDFIKRNYNYVHSVSFSGFSATKFSDVYSNPDKYGMVLPETDEAELNPACTISEKNPDGNTTFGKRKELTRVQDSIGQDFSNQWSGRTSLLYIDELLEICRRAASGDQLLPYSVSPLFSKDGNVRYASIVKENKSKFVSVNASTGQYLKILGKHYFKDDAINELSKVTGYPPELSEFMAEQMIISLCKE